MARPGNYFEHWRSGGSCEIAEITRNRGRRRPVTIMQSRPVKPGNVPSSIGALENTRSLEREGLLDMEEGLLDVNPRAPKTPDSSDHTEIAWTSRRLLCNRLSHVRRRCSRPRCGLRTRLERISAEPLDALFLPMIDTLWMPIGPMGLRRIMNNDAKLCAKTRRLY